MKRSFGDLGGPFLHVEVWGNIVSGPRPRTGSDANHPTMWSMDKKGKMKEMESQSEGARQWQVLERWDVDLRQLTPFTSEVSSIP